MNVIQHPAFARRIADQGITVFSPAAKPAPELTAEQYADNAVRELAAREIARDLGIAGVPPEFHGVTFRKPSVPRAARKSRLKHRVAMTGIALGSLVGILGIGYAVGLLVEWFTS